MEFKHYKLLKKEELKDLGATGYYLEHDSGAKVLAVKNDDDNKVFYAGFRTPPENSTGVPHILEHSVLNGSRKYRTKEPFMDLLKGSLNTFLNAMTYPDKTVYPVASRNDKDFAQLMDVYLDAVFYPSIYKRKEVFLQEGWHYDISDRKDPLSYKGVVYNEMRGAYSDPMQQVYDRFAEAIFPDTEYAYSSGGDPYVIPELSYEEFLDFHRRYYHPSNAYLYLYGDGDLQEELKHLHEFLKDFDKETVDSMPRLQKDFSSRRDVTARYPIGKDEDPTGKDYLLFGAKIGEKKNMKQRITRDILSKILFSDDGAPIKKALLEEGIGEDIQSVTADGRETTMGILVKNTSVDRKKRFMEIIEEELRKTAEKGIPEKELLAAISQIEFSLKEAGGFPVPGLIRGLSALDSWLYDGDPFEPLSYRSLLEELKSLAKTDYYENFIREKLLDNPHSVLLSMNAVPGLTGKRDEETEEALDEKKKRLSFEELDRLIEENKALEEYQKKEDTEEERATIPELSLDDIDDELPTIPREERTVAETTTLFHEIFTGKLLYLDLAFDLSVIGKDEIGYASLLSDLIGLMATEHFSYDDIITETELATGGVHIHPDVLTGHDDELIETLIVSTKINEHKAKDAFDILKELFTTTFDDKKRLKELLIRSKISMQEDIITTGNVYGIKHASAGFDDRQAYRDALDGLPYYDFLCELIDGFDDNAETIAKALASVRDKIFRKNGLVVNITSDREDFEEALKPLENFLDGLPENEEPSEEKTFEKKSVNTGFAVPAGINYVCLSKNLKDTSFEYDGSQEVVASYLSNEYLYRTIRAQGGAYGQGIRIARTGRAEFYSYRDPNLENTLNIYRNTGEFLKNIALSDDELRRVIIGTVNRFDPPMTPRTAGYRDLFAYLTGRGQKERQQYFRRALKTTKDDFTAFGDVLTEAAEEYITVVGDEERILAKKEQFGDVKKL